MSPPKPIDLMKYRSKRRDGEPHVTSDNVFLAAIDYRLARLSFIPIAPDGRKMPYFSLLPSELDSKGRARRKWRVFRDRLPRVAEIKAWYEDPDPAEPAGIGVLGGAVSGGLEIIDVDNAETFNAFQRKLIARAPKLFNKIVWVRSPRPGVHGYYRCSSAEKSQKLAERPLEPEYEGGPPRRQTLIETKGEGGYCVAPASPDACHPSGIPYLYLTGRDLTMVELITDRQREILLDTARLFNEVPAEVRPLYTDRRHGIRKSSPRQTRPGDIFNVTASWQSILEPHGWEYVGDGGDGASCWRRPGKDFGVSATTDYAASNMFFAFSTNCYPFEAERGYTKFAAYALLNYGGDFHAAAVELSRNAAIRRALRPKHSEETLAQIYRKS